MKHRYPSHYIVFLVGVLASGGCVQDRSIRSTSVSPPIPVSAEAEPQAGDAHAVLMRMARYLATTPRFTVHVSSDHEVVQPSGQKIEYNETRQIVVERPQHFYAESQQGAGEKQFVFYDGQNISVFNPNQQVYAQASKPGTIDDAIVYFLKDLQMRLPLAVLLLNRFPEEMERRTKVLDYVEKTLLQGKPTHHLIGSTDTVDYQLWIAEGPQPLPVRVVLTYKYAEGQPQFHAQFSDWNLSPTIEKTQFTFIPPEGSKKIAFLAEARKLESQPASSPTEMRK